MGVLYVGTWRTLRVPDKWLGGQGHPWYHGWPCLTPRKMPWNLCVDIFIRSVSRMGGPLCVSLEDVEGPWQETWRTGSSLKLWKYLVDTEDNILKVSCWYLYWKCVKNGGSFMWVLGGYWGFLTGDLEDRAILDGIDVLGRPQGSCPESFVSISLFLFEL